MSWAAVAVAAGGVLSAGIGAASAGSSGGTSAPAQTNPGVSLLQYIKGLKKGLPGLTDLEAQYRPQYGELNLADQGQYLTGLLGMGGVAQGAAQSQLFDARSADIGNMAGNVPGVMNLLGSIDPNGRAAAQRATTMADDAYARSQGLTFQEKRGADQLAREAFGARGRINDNASVAAEIMGREDVLAAKRKEAADLNADAFTLNQQYASPALNLLGGIPASIALGQDYLGASAGAIGKNTPQLINPDAGINLGMANASNLAAWQQAQAARSAGQGAVWGQLGSSLIGLAGTLAKSS